MSQTIIAEPAHLPAGLLRRLGALVSDSLVVVGLLLLGSLPCVPLLQRLNAKAMVPSEVGWIWCAIYWMWLLAIWVGFITYFWTRGGQTVGMKAWRIRVEQSTGASLEWTQAVARLVYATLPWLPCIVLLTLAELNDSALLKHMGQGLSLLGVAGLLYRYIDPQHRTWHDLMSKSRVSFLPKLH